MRRVKMAPAQDVTAEKLQELVSIIAGEPREDCTHARMHEGRYFVQVDAHTENHASALLVFELLKQAELLFNPVVPVVHEQMLYDGGPENAGMGKKLGEKFHTQRVDRIALADNFQVTKKHGILSIAIDLSAFDESIAAHRLDEALRLAHLHRELQGYKQMAQENMRERKRALYAARDELIAQASPSERITRESQLEIIRQYVQQVVGDKRTVAIAFQPENMLPKSEYGFDVPTTRVSVTYPQRPYDLYEAFDALEADVRKKFPPSDDLPPRSRITGKHSPEITLDFYGTPERIAAELEGRLPKSAARAFAIMGGMR